MGRRPLRALATVAIAGAALAAPAGAEAANRFASPTGTAADACTAGDPCDIVTAVTGDAAGRPHDVTLTGGVPPATPYMLASQLEVPDGVTVHGTPGARPHIESTVIGGATLFVRASSVLRDVSINHTDSNNAAVFTRGTIERVHARSAGHAGCTADGGSLVRDSVCWTTTAVLSSGSGLALQWGGQSADQTITVRNVTAVASAGSAAGVHGHAFINDGILTVNATNLIAYSQGGHDITGSGNPCCTGEVVNIILDHSNYDSEDESDTEATVTITNPGTGTNETAPPIFVSAGAGDFRQAANSAGTINQGVAGVGLGAFDLNGLDRFQGTAPDIGAHEFPEADPDPGGGGDGGGGGGGGGGVIISDPIPPPTGERDAALKRCKKKAKKNDWSKKRLNKCRKRARRLPA